MRAVAASVWLKTLLIAGAMTLACGQVPAQGGQPAAAPRPANTPGAPSSIFGTNLALFDGTDQVINSRATQQLLKGANVPMVRMPFRSGQGAAFEERALEAIRYMDAIPVVIVHGLEDPSALTDDRQLIALVQRFFADTLVYVELGNEQDLVDSNVMSYVNEWNRVVPVLKAMAPTYRFIGPAVSFPNTAFLATFTRLANPRPDAISWHEYACHSQDSDATCLAYLAHWSAHVKSVNQAVQAALGTTLPIMITEWNLDDKLNARSESPKFMREWTARALQTLAKSRSEGVVAALQYCAANNGNFNLVDSAASWTPQGQAFIQALPKGPPP
ncbi:MAG: hypothetical protein DLM67_22400 [Candidatus Nephthysia bennettiae]|uniref:hypothetical protein n=1 Tax=Candidatus Nephthysia bennettiae TaxID=3127016 RepID=UPI000DB07386|nr:MAG: hypothetical protein DLM67_22400 [Candidatus Dormibacteraeota bacterium]